MSHADTSGFTGPFIAGTDNPLHGSRLDGTGDDAFAPTDTIDFDNNSPDTLQSLDSSRKGNPQLFVSPQDLTSFHMSMSPNDGSFNEYSSDSAESSRKGDRTSPPPPADNTNNNMEMFSTSTDGNPRDVFDEILSMDDQPFLGGMVENPHNGALDFNFADTSMDFGPHDFNQGTVTPSDTLFNSVSPAGNDYSHQRQLSQSSAESYNYPIASREVSPGSRINFSQQSTPSATLQSNSPSAMNGFTSSQLPLSNGLGSAPQQWFAQSAPLPIVDPSPSQRRKLAGSSTKARQNGQQRNGRVNGRQQAQSTMSLATPALSALPPRPTLIIKPIPPKSRVETQIRLRMTLRNPPPGVSKLHLPTHTISKPKLQVRPPPQPRPDTLELSVSLVCTSALNQPEVRARALTRAINNPQRHLPPEPNPENGESPQTGSEVRICTNCMGRERKRAARKKVKQVDSETAWGDDEAYRVVVFNTAEIRELKSDTEDPEHLTNNALAFDAPVRIACYCRHHNEKLGFNLIFTLKDSTGRFVAQGVSDPIMITDDHKTAPLAAQATAELDAGQMVQSGPEQIDAMNSAISEQGAESTGASPAQQDDVTFFAQSQLQGQAPPSVVSPGSSYASGTTPRAISRPASPSHGGPSKKRKSSNSRIPNTLAMTKMDTSPSLSVASRPGHVAVSPFAQPLGGFSQAEQLFTPSNGQGPYNTNPSTPNSVEPNPFNNFNAHRASSVDNMQINQHMFSAPASNHPSRAPSPKSLRSAASTQQNTQLAQAMAAANFMPMPINSSQPRGPPMIHKVIPGEGSRMGGIEVTILGANFYQGVDVHFGSARAVTTTYWGAESLVCLLPPSSVSGVVPVIIQERNTSQPSVNLSMSHNQAFFRYIDDEENHLMRLALQCVGGKTLGGNMDVTSLARHVIDSFNSRAGGSSGDASNGNGGSYIQNSPDQLELQLLKCLDVIDLDDSPREADLDRKNPSGHTLLHLASCVGFQRLVAGLLARGADPNARDNGGFTPLHMAAIFDRPEITRRLILAGGDSRACSLSDERPLEMTESRAVARAIRFSERPTRSRSDTSLHSRVSSMSSVRSLMEPLGKARTHEEPLSPGEESPEYTSGDFEDEDPDEDNYISMRRNSRRQSSVRPDHEMQGGYGPAQADDFATQANAAGAALKEHVQQQLHQFQQSMALHLQNLSSLPHLPHLPQMPQIPTLAGRPMLPDYQAYLQQAPFMRRMTQYMPSMTGGRPESPDRQTPKMEHRWWDLSSYMSNTAAPPPSYEEIFPQEDMDRKQASAAQAAAEAAADLKCSRLFDQPQSTQVAASSQVEVSEEAELEGETTEIPSVLKIGRKNAITKEQQEQFLRAREARLKRLSNDRNLFFIWIPLLLVMICAMMYSYFPSLFVFVWAIVQSAVRFVRSKTSQVLHQGHPDQVVEVAG